MSTSAAPTSQSGVTSKLDNETKMFTDSIIMGSLSFSHILNNLNAPIITTKLKKKLII